MKGGLATLRHRDFALLFAGTIVSHTGDLLQSMAQSWLVFDLTHSGLKLGVLGFCQLLPRLLLGALGGVLVDRFDRRRVLIVTQAVAMVQSIILFLLVATGRVTYGEIVVLTVVLGVADTLHLTARHALIPKLVPREELQAGVALNAAGINATIVLGPLLGGALLGFLGVAGCLAINAVSFVAILAALFAMRFQPEPPAPGPGLMEELLEGFRYVAARDRLWVPVAIAYAVAGLAMAFSRLLPVFARDILHGGATEYGELMAAMGLGALAASIGVAMRGQGGMRRLYGAVAVLATGLLAFALTSRLWAAIIGLTIVGAAQMVFRTSAIATCHVATDDAHRGRVMSIFLLDYGFWSFGTLWLGWLSDARGPRFAVMAGALSCVLVVVLVAAGAGQLRRAAAAAWRRSRAP